MNRLSRYTFESILGIPFQRTELRISDYFRKVGLKSSDVIMAFPICNMELSIFMQNTLSIRGLLLLWILNISHPIKHLLKLNYVLQLIK